MLLNLQTFRQNFPIRLHQSLPKPSQGAHAFLSSLSNHAISHLSDKGSALLGLVDGMYIRTARLNPHRPYYFAEGYGNLELAHAHYAQFMENLRTCSPSEGHPPDIQVRSAPELLQGLASAPPASLQHATLEEACYQSPSALFLPRETQLARFMQVIPEERGYFNKPPRAIVVHYPCTADEDYLFRLQSVVPELLDNNIISILPLPPFYGMRRRHGQKQWFALDVSDFILQSSVSVEEALTTLHWLRYRYPGLPIVLSGFSWGGFIASATALSLQHGPDVALAPCVAPHSPEAFIAGLLQLDIHWEALRRQDASQCLNSRDERLRTLFRSYDLEQLSHANPASRLGTLAQINAKHDSVVHPHFTQSLYKVLTTHLKRNPKHLEYSDPIRLKWIPGGHTSALLWSKQVFVPEILHALQSLTPQQPTPQQPTPDSDSN